MYFNLIHKKNCDNSLLLSDFCSYFRPEHWTDVFIVVPVICFGYQVEYILLFEKESIGYIPTHCYTTAVFVSQCHLSVVPIYSCMEKRTLPEFTKTLLVAMAICLFAYTGTASFGYLTFGGNVKPDILVSYDPTPDVLVAVVLIAVKMYTTYPILLFVGRYVQSLKSTADDSCCIICAY